jgi:isopenicillin N synthase-like dioxygenase
MLNIWTNDYIRATEHRVVNSSNEQRYSIISFIEPSLDTVVKPIELPS